MRHRRKPGTLTIDLNRDLNLFTARCIERLVESDEHVIIDLRDIRFADTEGIAHLHRLQLEGTSITVRNPPDLFFEILRVLELNGLFEIHTDATA